MKILSEQLSQLCRPFGNILSVVVLHGRGQALVEMDSPSAVDTFLTWSCSESKGDRFSTADRLFGDETGPSVVPMGASSDLKLKFDSWSQCATVQRGRARKSSNGISDNNNDSNSNYNYCDNYHKNLNSDNGNDTNSSSCNIKSNNINNNDGNDYNNIENSDNKIRSINNKNTSTKDINNTSNNESNSGNSENNRNKKILSDETIRLEASRCLAVVIKKIVFEDSESRMRERKLRTKNHEILLESISRKRIKKENSDESDFNCVKKDRAESSKKENENENEKIAKSEFFLNDWRNNKYCLNKEELGLICWNYVASGGNIEFCPYYKQKFEGNNKISRNKPHLQNKNQITPDNSITQTNTNTENIQNSPNFPGICPLFHISRPVTELPINLRAFEFEDFFPLARYVISLFLFFIVQLYFSIILFISFCFVFFVLLFKCIFM
jgi:hypothetical protein